MRLIKIIVKLSTKIVGIVLCMISVGFSASAFFKSDLEHDNFEEFFTIDENTPSNPQNLNPNLQIFDLSRIQTLKKLSVINFIEHRSPLKKPNEPYNRQKQYGSWRKDPAKTCLNTRGVVLHRSSKVPVTIQNNKSSCTVVAGQWYDPYTDATFTDAKDVQIDHVVPLKHSYVMGGWKWSDQKKCHYANFMKSRYHLLPVYGRENSRKSDDSPSSYLPPNPQYQCEYLRIWLAIKLEWQLPLVQPEIEAIQSSLQKNHCDPKQMAIDESELHEIRDAIQLGSTTCQ